MISDAHGYPELISNALDHGGFRPGIDDFVYAGDLVDRGPDPEGCLELIDRYATEVLVGNHELAVLMGFEIIDQTSESVSLREALLERVFAAEPAGAWNAVAAVGDVLVSHGGLSSSYAGLFPDEFGAGAAALAEQLNREFHEALRRELLSGEWADEGVLSDVGPLWFRPSSCGRGLPAPGRVQVVGHSPPVPELEESGFYMVDPRVSQESRDLGRYRYAVIEDGRVRVEEKGFQQSSTTTSSSLRFCGRKCGRECGNRAITPRDSRLPRV